MATTKKPTDGKRVRTLEALEFGGKNPLTLPRGSLGTVQSRGTLQSTVAFDASPMPLRRVPNEVLKPI